MSRNVLPEGWNEARIRRVLDHYDTVSAAEAAVAGAVELKGEETTGPELRRVLRLLVASPNDVHEERAVLEDVVRELNIVWGRRIGVQLDLIKWETHSFPRAGDPQSVIASELPDDCEIFIGILWTRFGTPTPRAPSGTIEEFQRAYERYRAAPNQSRIMFYFKDAPVRPSQLDPEQLSKINEFREYLNNKALYSSFSTVDDFASLLRAHISMQVQEWGETWAFRPNGLVKSRHRFARSVSLEVSADQEPEEEDEGLFDLVEAAQDNLSEVNATVGRMTMAIEIVGKQVANRTRSANSADLRSDPGQARQIIDGAASDLEQFVENLEREIAPFSAAYSKAMDATGRAMTIVLDFDEEGRTALAQNIGAIRQLSEVITSTRESMAGMRESMATLPRVTAKLARAKRKTLSMLDKLDDELGSAVQLSQQVLRTLETMGPTGLASASRRNG